MEFTQYSQVRDDSSLTISGCKFPLGSILYKLLVISNFASQTDFL